MCCTVSLKAGYATAQKQTCLAEERTFSSIELTVYFHPKTLASHTQEVAVPPHAPAHRPWSHMSAGQAKPWAVLQIVTD